jgi:hypothetical protein
MIKFLLFTVLFFIVLKNIFICAHKVFAPNTKLNPIMTYCLLEVTHKELDHIRILLRDVKITRET